VWRIINDWRLFWPRDLHENRQDSAMKELSDLPPSAQAERYRVLAQDARREAAAAKGSARQSYLIIAENWDKLAADAAEAARKLTEKPPSGK